MTITTEDLQSGGRTFWANVTDRLATNDMSFNAMLTEAQLNRNIYGYKKRLALPSDNAQQAIALALGVSIGDLRATRPQDPECDRKRKAGTINKEFEAQFKRPDKPQKMNKETAERIGEEMFGITVAETVAETVADKPADKPVEVNDEETAAKPVEEITAKPQETPFDEDKPETGKVNQGEAEQGASEAVVSIGKRACDNCKYENELPSVLPCKQCLRDAYVSGGHSRWELADKPASNEPGQVETDKGTGGAVEQPIKDCDNCKHSKTLFTDHPCVECLKNYYESGVNTHWEPADTPEAKAQACHSCKHSNVSSVDHPCDECLVRVNSPCWEPAEIPASKLQACHSCKHYSEPTADKPCKTCLQHVNNPYWEPAPDPVNHPAHYQRGGLECIDIIEAAVSGLSGFEGYCVGNVLKYCWRWKEKGGVEDLRKAAWYLRRLTEAKQ